MRVNNFNTTLEALTRSNPSNKLSTASTAAEGSFGETLARMLDKVEQPQKEAERQSERLALGDGNLHETALALEKADITLKLAVKVRNKVVEAYQEVMRMQV